MKTIKLTALEARVIKHRLEVPDCTAEAYGPSNEDRWGVSEAEALEKIQAIYAATITEAGDGSMTIEFNEADPDQVEIIGDLLDGNTFGYGAAEQAKTDDSGLKQSNEMRAGKTALRAVQRVNRKFAAAGFTEQIPY